MASAITFTSLNFSGTPSPDDVLAATYIVTLKNQEIAVQNAALAAQTPPGTPIPLILVDTPNLKASYLALLMQIVTSAHLSYIGQAKSNSGFATRFTEAQIATINANLLARLNAGESAASVVADTAA